MKKQDIRDLMKLFSSTENVSKMKLKHDDFEIELEKSDTQNTTKPTITESIIETSKPTQPSEQSNTITPKEAIASPMVGTFYQAPSPGAKPFVKVGDTVSKGQCVAIIEAMKIMNEIEAEFDCKIKKILVNDGQPVEFGMSLFEVEKD